MRDRLKHWLGRLANAQSGEGVVVEIYSKPDCCLCDEAKARLQQLQRQYGFKLQEVDITSEPQLFAEYHTRIPLIWVNGQLACKYRVDEQAILRKMRTSG